MRKYTTHTVARNSKKENICVDARARREGFVPNQRNSHRRFIDTANYLPIIFSLDQCVKIAFKENKIDRIIFLILV